MADYKVIIREDLENDAVKWEPGCPLIFDAIQVSRNTESGQAFLQARLRNISSSEVKRYVIQYTISFESGETQVEEITALDADIPAGGVSTLRPLELANSDAAAVDYKVLKVTTPSEDWISSADPQAIPEKDRIELDEKAAKERNLLIDEGHFGNQQNKAYAKAHSALEQDGWWICLCGMPNVQTANCNRCSTSLDYVKKLDKPDFLNQSADERRKRLEAEKKRAEERAAKLAAAKAKAFKISKVAIPIAVVIIALIIVFTVIIPRVNYGNAMSLYDEGKYAEAYEKFAGLGDLEDSQTKVAEAHNAMVKYVKEHPSSDNETTVEYLEFMNKQGLEEVHKLVGLVYPWTYEFSLTSKSAFDANSGNWTELEPVTPANPSFYASAILLVRADCDEDITWASRQLEVTWEIRKPGQQSWSMPRSSDADVNGTSASYSSTGKSYARDLPMNVSSDGGIDTSSCMYYNNDAWRVTVTDPDTDEVLFTAEIPRAAEAAPAPAK